MIKKLMVVGLLLSSVIVLKGAATKSAISKKKSAAPSSVVQNNWHLLCSMQATLGLYLDGLLNYTAVEKSALHKQEKWQHVQIGTERTIDIEGTRHPATYEPVSYKKRAVAAKRSPAGAHITLVEIPIDGAQGPAMSVYERCAPDCTILCRYIDPVTRVNIMLEGKKTDLGFALAQATVDGIDVTQQVSPLFMLLADIQAVDAQRAKKKSAGYRRTPAHDSKHTESRRP